MRNFHKYGIDTHGRTSGKIKTICPECNATRGHKGNKSFSIDLDKGLCYCHHCGHKFYVPDDAEERERQQLKEKYNRTSKLPSHFPPPRLRRRQDKTQREPGTILDTGTLLGATSAGRTAHH